MTSAKPVTEKEWFYRDLDEKIWGPFRRDQMKRWHEKGKMTKTLPVGVERDGPFVLLGKLGDTPFANISPDTLYATKEWFYKAKYNARKIFGPFETSVMRTWYTSKKLPRGLLVSSSQEGPFVPLFSLIDPCFAWNKAQLVKQESRRSINTLIKKQPSRRRMTTVNQKVENISLSPFDEDDEDMGGFVRHPPDALSLTPPAFADGKETVAPKNTKKPSRWSIVSAPHWSISKWASEWRRQTIDLFAGSRSASRRVSRVAGLGWQGACPWRPKPNQDRMCVFQCEDTGSLVCCVMDGHGPVGHEVSDFVMKNLESTLTFDDLWAKDVETALTRSIEKLDRVLCDRSGIDCTLSGTTLVIAVVRDENITIGNVGDSTLSVVACDDDVDSSMTVLQISEDHKPEDPEETIRITKAGGLVFAVDPDGNGPQGPVRVWRKQKDGPGIAMSRSLGDAMATQIGVVSTPDVKTWTFAEIAQRAGKKRCAGILLASDALYEFMDGPAICAHTRMSSLVHDSKTSKNVDPVVHLTDLATEIQKRWTKEEEGYVDDTTLVLALFD